MKNIVQAISFCLACLCCSCGGNESILKSGKESPTPANSATPLSPVHAEIAAMRTAGFDWIYALRRADNGKIEAGDREFAKNLTDGANRRVVTEDDMYILVGTNTELSKETIETLLTRFALGTYPKRRAPDANTNSNTDSNTDSNANANK